MKRTNRKYPSNYIRAYDEYEDEGFSRDEAISSIASTLGVPKDIADTIYDWYDSEGSVDDYTNVDDFVDYVSDDIYDMLDACTDTELRKEIGGYLGVDYYDEDDEDY